MMVNESDHVSTQAEAFRAELLRLRRPHRQGGQGGPSDPDGTPAGGPGSGPTGGPAGGIDLGPASVYEAITRQIVESLRDELREIRSRLNTLLFMMIGAIMVELAMRIIGP